MSSTGWGAVRTILKVVGHNPDSNPRPPHPDPGVLLLLDSKEKTCFKLDSVKWFCYSNKTFPKCEPYIGTYFPTMVLKFIKDFCWVVQIKFYDRVCNLNQLINWFFLLYFFSIPINIKPLLKINSHNHASQPIWLDTEPLNLFDLAIKDTPVSQNSDNCNFFPRIFKKCLRKRIYQKNN